MIEFIPLEYYGAIFLNVTLFLTVLVLIHSSVLQLQDGKHVVYLEYWGLFLLIFSIVYIGLRPISSKYFVDMRTYANHFTYYMHGGEIYIQKDVFFHYFMKLCSNVMSVHMFFLVCAFLYIFPMYLVSKRLFQQYWFYGFFLLLTSFSFWSYGVNGIRNGIATSLFLWAIASYKKVPVAILLLIISTLVHKTLLLPVGALAVSLLYPNPRFFTIVWALCIPMSLVMGGFWENLFASLGFADDRLAAYLSPEETGAGGSFRFDFLLYSAVPVAIGWFFMTYHKFEDKMYSHLLNTYLIVNACWILIIRANFSNRFAYLSWFLMALIVVYPFLKSSVIKEKNVVLGNVVLAYFAFTYLMFNVYYS